MTTTWQHRNRTQPAVDETIHAKALARYLGNSIHPAVAVILAYEDSIIHPETSTA